MVHGLGFGILVIETCEKVENNVDHAVWGVVGHAVCGLGLRIPGFGRRGERLGECVPDRTC